MTKNEKIAASAIASREGFLSKTPESALFDDIAFEDVMDGRAVAEEIADKLERCSVAWRTFVDTNWRGQD